MLQQAPSFIKELNNHEPRMGGIVKEFQEIAEELQKKQKETTIAGVFGGITCAFSIIAAPFTGGLTLITGGTVLWFSIMLRGSQKTESVEKQLREFLEKIERQKNELQEINETCEELEQNRGGDLEELQETREPVSRLKSRSQDVLSSLLQEMEVVRDTETPENSTELINVINQSAGRLQKIIDEVDEMKKEVKVFRGEK